MKDFPSICYCVFFFSNNFLSSLIKPVGTENYALKEKGPLDIKKSLV